LAFVQRFTHEQSEFQLLKCCTKAIFGQEVNLPARMIAEGVRYGKAYHERSDFPRAEIRTGNSGRIVAAGTPEEIRRSGRSVTGRCL